MEMLFRKFNPHSCVAIRICTMVNFRSGMTFKAHVMTTCCTGLQ